MKLNKMRQNRMLKGYMIGYIPMYRNNGDKALDACRERGLNCFAQDITMALIYVPEEDIEWYNENITPLFEVPMTEEERKLQYQLMWED